MEKLGANVLGYEPGEMDTVFLMDKIHPDDKSCFLNFEHKITELFKELSFDKIKNYKVQYDYRRNKDNKYLRILHQATSFSMQKSLMSHTICLEVAKERS